MRPSQNIPLPPRIYPLFNKCMCDPTLPESTPPPPEYISFSTTIILCGPPRIYPSPESTPLFNQFMCATTTICDFPFSSNVYVRPSQNLPLLPRIYPQAFQQLIATLPESTPPSQNISPFQQMYVRLSQNLPSLPEYTPLFNNYMRLSQNIPLPPRISLFNNYNIMRPSQNLPLPPRIYPPF